MPENRTQNWLQNRGTDFIAKEMLPLDSAELNTWITTSWEMLEIHRNSSADNSLTQGPVDKAVKELSKRVYCR